MADTVIFFQYLVLLRRNFITFKFYLKHHDRTKKTIIKCFNMETNGDLQFMFKINSDVAFLMKYLCIVFYDLFPSKFFSTLTVFYFSQNV